jgi:hypothetical protein
MNPNKRWSTLSWWLALWALLVATASVFGGRSEVLTGEAVAAVPQDVIRLESRINQLEQRLHSIEISFRSLEQQVRLSINAPGPARGARDPEMVLLRGEVEALRKGLAEIRCGLVRVDERTLTPAAREARRKGATDGADPCRLNASAPLRFSVGP